MGLDSRYFGGEDRRIIGKGGKQVGKESPRLIDHLIGGLLSGH